MTQYYFLGTLLPELQLDQKPEIDLEYLLKLLNEQLSCEDLKKVESLKLYFDIENIRYLWNQQKINRVGNQDAKELQESLLNYVGLPQYVFDFMDRYDSVEKRLSHFSSLFSTYFQESIKEQTGFLKDLLILEKEIRLVLLALRTKKYHKDLLFELQFENSEDPLVAQILSQKDHDSYEPPEKYHELKELFNRYSDDPLMLQKVMLEYRFKKIQELTGLESFTIDRIIAYFFQLVLLEKWLRLDAEKGKKIMLDALRGQNGE